MLSDVSSLTDLSDSDSGSYLPSKPTQRNTKKTQQYQLKGSLRPPRSTTYSTKHIYDQLSEGLIDLSPEYQRDIVWPDSKQIGLIDSILRNFYVPPVIFAVSQSEDGTEKRVCIDGKQRLTSIFRFMDGKIPFKDPNNVKLYYQSSGENPKGKLLPQQYRQQFANKQITCIEYQDISDNAEREIFQRVQLGVALTPAERMQAIAGPWSELVRTIIKLLKDFPEDFNWLATRGRDFQNVTTAVYLMEKPDSSFPGASTLDKWLQRKTPPTKQFRARVNDVFSVFRELVLDKKYCRTFEKPTRVSPAEFVMCAVLINKFMESSSLSQISQGITKMREDVRKTHEDIRANTRCMKTMTSFIFERFPTALKRNPSGELTAVSFVHGSKRGTSSPNIEGWNQNGKSDKGKRKRGSVESGSDGEQDEPVARKTVPSPAKKSVKTAQGSKASPSESHGAHPPRAASTSTVSASDSGRTAVATPLSAFDSSDRLAPLRAARAKVAAAAAKRPIPSPLQVTTSAPARSSRFSQPLPTAISPSTRQQIDHFTGMSISNSHSPTISQSPSVSHVRPTSALGFSSNPSDTRNSYNGRPSEKLTGSNSIVIDPRVRRNSDNGWPKPSGQGPSVSPQFERPPPPHFRDNIDKNLPPSLSRDPRGPPPSAPRALTGISPYNGTYNNGQSTKSPYTNGVTNGR